MIFQAWRNVANGIERRSDRPFLTVVRSDADLIALYVRSQERRDLTVKTVTVTRRALVGFSRAFPDGFASVTAEAIETWLDGRQIKAKTRYWWISLLDTFYAWAVDSGHLEGNPAGSIRRPRLKPGLPRPIADADLRRAIEAAEPIMLAWVLLGAFAGMRCQEIAGLASEDVDEQHGVLRIVHAKGGRERVVPLHPDVLAALKALPMPASGPVFRCPNGSRMTADYLGHSLTRYLHSLGIASTAHKLRHWYASSLYRSTRDLRMVQELLGHASPTVTANYAACDPLAAAPAVAALKVT
jgi:integrase/recombinase XerC